MFSDITLMRKKAKKRIHRNYQKRLTIILGIILIITVAFILFEPSPSGNSVQQINIVSLPEKQIKKVSNLLASSEFVNDVPSGSPISLRFFSFSGGKRVWHDAFLIGEDKEPVVYLTLNAKYIEKLTSENLCDIINKANKNGDLGFHSEYSKATLLWKYKSMLKYRDCFGF
jgi:hypothetical protein